MIWIPIFAFRCQFEGSLVFSLPNRVRHLFNSFLVTIIVRWEGAGRLRVSVCLHSCRHIYMPILD
jgi:hypothetical protein